MAAYENDSEAYQWDFGIFDPFPNPPYYGSGADQETTFYSNYCVREDTSRAACEEHMPESVFTQNLSGPYTRQYNSVTEDGWEVTDETGPSSLCSSSGGYSCRREFSLKISDEYSVVDEQVGRRLNQMHPIPHVPRTNGDIPSFDEATSDHQRLLERVEMWITYATEDTSGYGHPNRNHAKALIVVTQVLSVVNSPGRLRLYDLVERKVQGDGNCQFRALSDQLYQTSEHHEFVRQQVVEQLKSHPEIYNGYVPMTYGDYLKKISQNGEWGDHVTLQAAADFYGVKIFVITSFKDTCYIEILPSIEKSKRVIFLSFWAEVHYNSIYLEENDLPTADTKKKKRWWQLGNKH